MKNSQHFSLITSELFGLICRYIMLKSGFHLFISRLFQNIIFP
ncbi:hypothetical protein HMPREF0880_01109 [Yokenella regensburgei ATCC 43003]|nr:hypothetical protein HMPREF0880_01109 [Yokenella regensburgei ATCC 43003]